MERISEYDLGKELMSVYSGGQMDQNIVRLALQELKERREADSKPLDIKGQLRLVRDKCPDVWDFNYGAGVGLGCPSHYGIVDKSEYCVDTDECKECWDKALEGDANE